jgi:hypothetical protein
MSVDGSCLAVENLIADHVASSFQQKGSPGKGDNTAAQVRSRITEHFAPSNLGSDQDNSPPAVVALYSRLFRAFAVAQPSSSIQDRSPELVRLQETLKELHRTAPASIQGKGRGSHLDLLLERQQIALKNEFTEGFGRIELSLVAVTALTLILIGSIDYLWALPIFGLSVGRSWHLDRQCRKRRARIAEIDAIIETAA